MVAHSVKKQKKYYGWFYKVVSVFTFGGQVRVEPTYIIFITHFGLGIIVKPTFREGVNFHPCLTARVLYPFIGPLLRSLLYWSYSGSTTRCKGIEGAIYHIPNLSSHALSPAGFSAHFLHNCVKNAALGVSRNAPFFRRGLGGCVL